jgi:transcriptional regulator with XRE-family HTH domain
VIRTVTDPADRAYLVALGKRIKIVRQARDLKQATVAERARIDRVYLSRIESGLHNPTAITLLHLAHALSVPVPLLVDDETTQLDVVRMLSNPTDR